MEELYWIKGHRNKIYIYMFIYKYKKSFINMLIFGRKYLMRNTVVVLLSICYFQFMIYLATPHQVF